MLFGHLLKEYHDGDPRYAKELPPLAGLPLSKRGIDGDFINSDAEQDSRHALRMLASR